MLASPKLSLLWFRWLVAVTIGVMFFGISMVLAPNLILQIFSLLFYDSPDQIKSFGIGAVAYISFAHAILGAVMFGWGAALLFTVLGAFRRGSREAWQTLAISICAWFIPDTSFSLWSGFWQNAILNLVFAVLFAIPLAATYRSFHETSG